MMLAICVPVAFAPDFPKRCTYTTYVVAACPDCGRQMWMGTRIKALVESRAAQATCGFCALLVHHVGAAAKFHVATEFDRES